MSPANALLKEAPRRLASLTLARRHCGEVKTELHGAAKKQPRDRSDALIRELPMENVLPGVPL